MKERPIHFNGLMVRALLDGSKTQERRVLPHLTTLGRPEYPGKRVRGYSQCFWLDTKDGLDAAANECRYGQPGDRLWVREAFDFLPTGGADQPQACEIVYWAGGSTEPRTAPTDYNPMIYGCEKVRPSIHMPRWASRITLEIVSVRVERLHDISEADAIAEGCKNSLHLRGGRFANENYAHLWWTLNGDGSWEANPWVWVVEFKRIES